MGRDMQIHPSTRAFLHWARSPPPHVAPSYCTDRSPSVVGGPGHAPRPQTGSFRILSRPSELGRAPTPLVRGRDLGAVPGGGVHAGVV